jgi:tetraacyldisaccharide 4'-kinase
MPDERTAERIWFGDELGPRLVRAALRPAELLYAAVVAGRGALYDGGLLATHDAVIPAVSVGNLSVGGTGKTPVSAWLASTLRDRGARPAIVLRGYGGDEPLVHELLNPDVPVVTAPDRVAGVREARRRGADVAVLDDAFQHRRLRRTADIVLVSADRWTGRVRLLPAGPWREPLRALRRATMVVVTRKAATVEATERVLGALAEAAPGVPGAVAHLAPAALRRVGAAGEMRPFATIAGTRVLAIAAVGDPTAFRRQLEAAGAHVETAFFADHHAYTTVDVERLAARAGTSDAAICTLKDAVKLAPLWPRAAAPLWYVSQRLELERGAGAMDVIITATLNARPPHLHPAG